MKSKAHIGGLTIIIFCFIACNNQSLPKTFLVPLDYNGTLRIVYEDKSAVDPKIDNGRSIFEFPKNGILILNKDLDDGINNDFYLVNNKGDRTKVNQIINFKDRLGKMPAVLSGVETVSGFTYSNNVPVIKGLVFIDYYLYNKDTTEIDKLSPRFDSLTNSVVSAFRANK